MSTKPRWTSTFVLAIIGTYVVMLFHARFAYLLTPDTIALTGIVCAAGYVVGIPLGMAASPYESEGQHFRKIVGFIASFVSGIVAGKLAEFDFQRRILENEVNGGRLLLFTSFLIVSSVQTFIFRRYYDSRRPHDTLVDPE